MRAGSDELLSCQFFQIFGRIFVKVFAAGFTAELDLLVLVYKDNGFAHLPELVTGDDTGAGFVRLVVVMSVMGAQRGRRGQGEYGDEGREYDVGCRFHVRFDWKIVPGVQRWRSMIMCGAIGVDVRLVAFVAAIF